MSQKKKKRSIFARIYIPLLSIAVLQALLLYGSLIAGGVFTDLRKNELDLLKEQSVNSYVMLENNMTNRWTNLSSTEEQIQTLTQSILNKQGKQWSDIESDSELAAEIVEASATELIYRLRANETTGIFFILNDHTPNESQRTGIYLRAASASQETVSNSDLELVRGLPSLGRDLSLSLSSYWNAKFTIGEADNEERFFTNPLSMGQSGLKKSSYGCYWCPPFRLKNAQDRDIITYSIPLLNDEGYTYGVLGVELSTDYIDSLLRSSWNGLVPDYFMVLGLTTGEEFTVQPMIATGSKYKQFFPSSTQSISLSKEKDTLFDDFVTMESPLAADQKLYGCVKQISIYPSNSPFQDEAWVLMAVQDANSLFNTSNDFKNIVLLSLGFAVIAGILLSLFAGKSIVRPIIGLVKRLRENDGSHRPDFEVTGIREIDSLSDAISSMTNDLVRSSQRTSRLIEMSGLPVGVYEIRKDPNMVYCSDGFLQLAGRKDLCGNQSALTIAAFEELLKNIRSDKLEEQVYRLKDSENNIHYIRIVEQEDESGVIGSVLDITKDVKERQRIEYERDYDSLTGIFNRRAFETEMDKKFSLSADTLKTGAMIMMDLDNLKFLNDTYGHDCGDDYIKAFANALTVFDNPNSLIARRSGDEFYVFAWGFDSKEEARSFIHERWTSITQKTLILPDNTSFRLRVSGGISWYPSDSELPSKLIHYADFAMYWVKHNHKGDLGEFHPEDYKTSGYLVSGQDALNHLIDDELVHFAFQPILSAHTGNTIGYELLMRSDVPELRTPDVILKMAKSQGKLHHIEYLTWNKGLHDARRMLESGYLKNSDLLFINSIANQTIYPSEQRQIIASYGDLMPQLVMEVTESEDNNVDFTSHKLSFVRSHGGKVAIDDFGTGYNSEMALISIPADIVKLDISFVRNVDIDPDKQLLVKNLIRFARQRNIEVLAEGVETYEELCTLLSFGVDYLQGYYFSKPLDIPCAVDNEAHEKLMNYLKNPIA